MLGELNERDARPAYVRFERRPVENKAESLKAGRSICVDVDYALVTPPYSKDCVVHKVERWMDIQKQNVREGRTPAKWLEQWKDLYRAWQNGQEAPLNGTDIRNWAAISPAECKNLIALGIPTIEDLAAANDQGLRRIGMGGIELKRKANAFLKGANDTGALVMENAKLKNEIDQLKGSLASLTDRIDRMKSEGSISVDRSPVSNGISVGDIMDEPEKRPFPSPTVDDELIAARELYFEKFGKKPHHMAKLETIMGLLDK